MKPFGAVVGGYVQVAGHSAHLVLHDEQILALGSYYDVGFHSLFGEPFYLRIYGCSAQAAGNEHYAFAAQLLYVFVDEL